jgi:MSHA pilin protein MshC
MRPNNFHLSLIKSRGFTLIELLVTIIILGILSVTVVPRIFTSSGFEAYAYRTELISTLRNIQLRAMQQTNDTPTCRQIKISSDTKILGLLRTDIASSNNCDANQWFDTTAGETTSVKVEGDHSVTFSYSDTDVFSFDQMGRPIDCAAPCEIYIEGEETLTITIEAEGYIHAS